MKKEPNPGKRKKKRPDPFVQKSRKILQKIFMDEVDSGRFKQALDKLAPEDYTQVMLYMMPFFMPAEHMQMHDDMLDSYFTGLGDFSEN